MEKVIKQDCSTINKGTVLKGELRIYFLVNKGNGIPGHGKKQVDRHLGIKALVYREL